MDILEFKKSTTAYPKRHPWELARVKVVHYLLRQKHFQHLLDIGSGDAFVLNELCKKNMADQYTAVDLAYDTAVVKQITSNTDGEISFLKQLPSQLSNKADGVLLLDVMEHCENESVVLNEITNSSITQNFTLLITVPAFQSLFSKHDELLLHYRRYNLKQVKKLCESNGLKVYKEGYFFISLLLVRVLQLFLEKLGLRKPTQSIDNWNGNKPTTILFSSILWMDFKVGYLFSRLGINLPGLSAYCICRPLQS